MKTLSEIAKEALQLDPAQRLTLARILIDLAEENEGASSEVEAVWEDEICRRLKSVRDGTAQSRTAIDVFADLDRHFAR